MGLFDKFKKKPEIPVDFAAIDTMEEAERLARTGVLAPLYLMPLRFNGEESARNRLFVPEAVVALKDRFDDQVERLLVEGKVNGYSCDPQYRGKSVIPCDLKVIARNNGADVFTETIHIW